MACVEVDVEKHPCDQPVICTEIFMTVSVQLKDKNGAPVRLDSFRVTRLPEGQNITPAYTGQQLDSYRDYGTYPVATDSDDSLFPKFTPTRVLFEGFIGEREVVSAEYVVKFDCCHVEWVSGERSIVVP
ncbi:MAG: hypothetical protein ABS46_09610 [Cytophagaceae bacterium SCN 52-12]|nr:MAG: hypothetical protein ABS46_09610 [Cytophagaceae bacterium SCN 52-12]